MAPQTSQLDSSSWFAAHTFLTRIQLPVNTTKPRGTTYQKQESAFKCITIMIFYFWIENVYPNRDGGPQFHFRPVAGCWPGVNSGYSVLQRPYYRFTTLNIELEVMWFVTNHSTSECFCAIMSFFCLTEFRYLIKGAIKRHFRRFTAVIHNFLPTLLSQLRDLSFQSKDHPKRSLFPSKCSLPYNLPMEANSRAFWRFWGEAETCFPRNWEFDGLVITEPSRSSSQPPAFSWRNTKRQLFPRYCFL